LTTLYAIRMVGGTIIQLKDGRRGIYASKALAEADLRAMPDTWTDYDHYEIIEINLVTDSSELLFK